MISFDGHMVSEQTTITQYEGDVKIMIVLWFLQQPRGFCAEGIHQLVCQWDVHLTAHRLQTTPSLCQLCHMYKVWSESSKTDFFTRLWVHFMTPLFAGWCPRTPSLPGTRDGPSAPLSPLWASVEESRVTAPCYCSCRAGCFLWYGGHCSLWVGSTRPNCKPTVLPTSFEMSETCCFSQEATETGGGGLDATSRQCTSTGIFGKWWHTCRSATTLLPWHGSVWLLVVPPN
jgi:hypothetical protein